MLDLKKAFTDWNKAFNREVLKQPAYKEAKASGKFERFLLSSQSLVVKDKGFIKYGTNYTREIDRGRSAGKLTPVKELYDWLEYQKYGLVWETEKQRWGIAWGIAKNHAKSGGYKFRNPSKRTEIIDNAIERTLPDLNRALLLDYRTFYESEVSRQLKQIEKI